MCIIRVFIHMSDFQFVLYHFIECIKTLEISNKTKIRLKRYCTRFTWSYRKTSISFSSFCMNTLVEGVYKQESPELRMIKAWPNMSLLWTVISKVKHCFSSQNVALQIKGSYLQNFPTSKLEYNLFKMFYNLRIG